MEELKQYYTTIFSVVYSSCGSYLAAGSGYGTIAVFDLSPFLDCDNNRQVEESERKPYYKFNAHKDPIYSLVSNKKLIISGSVGEIKAWKWTDVKRKEAKVLWTLQIPIGEWMKPEVNAMVLSEKDESLLYAGCGNNNVHCYDLESKTLKFTLEGHTDYIHCLSLGSSSSECVSGSEDGTVKIWDTRKSGSAVHTIEPYKHMLASRPELGKWIGCLAFDSADDWLVCGGAPILCIWHLRTFLPSTQLHKPKATSTVAHFYGGKVISAGSEPVVNHWSFDGKLLIEVPTSARTIYDIGINSSPSQKILSTCGSSHKIDVCTDFRYRDFSLLF